MLRGLFGNVWNMHQFSDLVALCMPYVMGAFGPVESLEAC